MNDRTGDIYYGITVNDRLYTVSYAEAGMSVSDPRKPWHPGESKLSNPRTIAYIPEDQYRPVAGIHSGPDGRLYIGTQPDYGLLGGALSLFDPANEQLQVYRNVIPGEEITALASDDRYIYCATDPKGGAGSKPDALPAHIFAWDPKVQTVVWDYPLANSHGVAALAAENGHLYFVRGNELIDLNTFHTHCAKRLPVPTTCLRAVREP